MRSLLKPMTLVGVCVVASAPRFSSIASGAQEERGRAIEERVDASELKVGTSTTFHVTIRRTEGAAHVRIHNSSPSAFSLEGGDDQLLTIGEVLPREFIFQVRAIGAGRARLSARFSYPKNPRKEARVIAEIITPHLEEIEGTFEQGRRTLFLFKGKRAGSSAYSLSAVSRLLRSTEASLLGALNFPELLALRDYVRENFRDCEEKLQKPSLHASLRDSFRLSPAAVFALLPINDTSSVRLTKKPSEKARRVLKEQADQVLDTIKDWIHRIFERAKNDELIVDLCVRSSSPHATFRMRPVSYSREVRGDYNITGQIPNVYLGYYVYKVNDETITINCGWDSPSKSECPYLDLVIDLKSPLECDLTRRKCTRPTHLDMRECK
jgi:hypothetical protein